MYIPKIIYSNFASKLFYSISIGLCLFTTTHLSAQPLVNQTGMVSVNNTAGKLVLKSTKNGVLVVAISQKNMDLDIKTQDIIVTVNEHKVATPEDLMRLIRNTPTSHEIHLTVVRKNKVLKIQTHRYTWQKFETPKPPETNRNTVQPPVPPNSN
ncbi:PDZ domain-containing protein [Acinetobacter rathckeae]|uniref:PDZ domain-containing protein n=1 Tax=Acinetobacter rathckeae TaxID=2605272 RepID=UPI0018A33143|nr:PDZ domain-containing protein [Acinetobacter rathckeae]MBF7687354.1 PDZ domain-containing protein [Acinetobacter rathckeae]MBF7694755.1 PDZ domain-containing protein [Acinetobacter rathckeae]